MPLDIESEKRGVWHVVARPAGIHVTEYSLPNRKAAQAAREAIASGVSGFSWDTGRDSLKAAVAAWREEHGMQLRDAVTRALAAVPEADPHGWCADSVRRDDTIRAEQAAYATREDSGGYTETVKLEDVEVGDEISFTYIVLPRRGRFQGLVLGRDQARTVTVRGTVTGEGRVMERHGNNYGEFVDGVRFPLDGAAWLDDDGSTGPVTTPVTVDWLAKLRRQPRIS